MTIADRQDPTRSASHASRSPPVLPSSHHPFYAFDGFETAFAHDAIAVNSPHIATHLPNAKIIHVVRDPLDTCVSCFSKLFRDGHNYAYDMEELGRYYRRYQRLMAHWCELLPRGDIIEVRYEDLVTHFETEVRRLLAHCGLKWNSGLSRISSDQQTDWHCQCNPSTPAYIPDSIGRAHMYGQMLKPLMGALKTIESDF